ncbi:MAG: flagellar motor protein MotB [Candidatus Gastranaerophilaceae bacterium]
MRNDYYSNSKDYINRWIVSYADLVTMLLALFMVLFAVSQNVTKYQAKMISEHRIQMPIDSMVIDFDGIDDIRQLFDKNIIKNNDIKFLKDSRGLVIRLDNSVLFDEGSAIIKKESYVTLDEIINTLSKMDNNIIVEGHTDSTPISNDKYPSNWELSTARATNIIAYMLKSNKIKPNRLSAMGYGEYMPIADNTSIGGRLANRRVDIIVLKK